MMHPTTTTTQPQSRLYDLANRLLPQAPGLSLEASGAWNDATFFAWIERTLPALSNGDQECARLLAALAQHDLLLEDIGQFDLLNALRSTTGAQAAELRAYLQEPWTS